MNKLVIIFMLLCLFVSPAFSDNKVKIPEEKLLWPDGIKNNPIKYDKQDVMRTYDYSPPDAPLGLNAKMILTVGDTWKFVEMSRSYPLIPGEWLTITANIEPGSYDWKRVVPDEKFAEDIRKVAIRIESDRKPKYSGPIYIDNVRAGR